MATWSLLGVVDVAVAPASASFGMLGPLQLSIDGTFVPLGGPKQRIVLATLLVNRNRPVAADALITAAWEDQPPGQARANIHVYVSNLRRLLAAAGVESRASLDKHAVGYQLTVADADVDVGRFMAENSEGVRAAAARRFEEASRHLSTALSEWRGPVLEDLQQFQFTEAFAAALIEQKVAAHAARAQAEIACGRAESVINELEALVAEHPYREPVWAQLMTAYYLAGRQSDALAAYRRLSSTLADELGIDPHTELRDLHGRILRQERLDVAESAQETAHHTMASTFQRSGHGPASRVVARLQAAAGQSFPVTGAATSIGRLADNHIVLTDSKVSRHHAIIIDTGVGFVIHDTGSANGVEVGGRRIVGSVTLTDGDQLRIGNGEFTFRLQAEDDAPTRP